MTINLSRGLFLAAVTAASCTSNSRTPETALAPSSSAPQPVITVRQAPEPVALPHPPPHAVDCEYRVDPVEALVSPRGATGTVNITTSAGCAWTASVATSSIALSATSGTGPAHLEYTVQRTARTYSDTDRNPIAVRWPTRTAGQNVWITQLPICSIGISGGLTVTVPAAAGTTRLAVLADSPFTCPWMATPDVRWITVISPTGVQYGDYDGFRFTVQPNDTGSARVGRIAIGEQILTVIQSTH